MLHRPVGLLRSFTSRMGGRGHKADDRGPVRGLRGSPRTRANRPGAVGDGDVAPAQAGIQLDASGNAQAKMDSTRVGSRWLLPSRENVEAGRRKSTSMRV